MHTKSPATHSQSTRLAPGGGWGGGGGWRKLERPQRSLPACAHPTAWRAITAPPGRPHGEHRAAPAEVCTRIARCRRHPPEQLPLRIVVLRRGTPPRWSCAPSICSWRHPVLPRRVSCVCLSGVESVPHPLPLTTRRMGRTPQVAAGRPGWWLNQRRRCCAMARGSDGWTRLPTSSGKMDGCHALGAAMGGAGALNPPALLRLDAAAAIIWEDGWVPRPRRCNGGGRCPRCGLTIDARAAQLCCAPGARCRGASWLLWRRCLAPGGAPACASAANGAAGGFAIARRHRTILRGLARVPHAHMAT